MRYAKILAVLGLLLIPASYAHAQRVAIGIGVPAYVGPAYGPPACAYGYYSYYPYACAPYGYYGPSWFMNGVFIGAGPWYRGYYGRPYYWGRPGFYGPGFRRDFDDRGWHGFRDHDGFRRDFDGRGSRGFHDESHFRGGGEFRGGGGFRGGRR